MRDIIDYISLWICIQMSEVGRPAIVMGGIMPMVWDPGLNQKEKVRWVPEHLILSFTAVDWKLLAAS